MPFHLIGESVEEGGYAIKVDGIVLEPGTIRVSATLTNNTERTIDLSNALNLYAPDGMRITAEGVSGELDPGNSLQREFAYVLPSPFLQENVMNYRLLYTPFGWSVPVMVFLLVDLLPEVSPPPTPREEDIPEPSTQEAGSLRQAYNGITGDPWKVLVLIYPNINFNYVENGVSKDLTASMPVADINAMKTDFLNLPHQNIVYDYSGNTAEMEVHFIEVSRPLTTLEPIDTGYWPDPGITQPELDLYAPPGKYDSVIVFWQVSDPNTGSPYPHMAGDWVTGLAIMPTA